MSIENYDLNIYYFSLQIAVHRDINVRLSEAFHSFHLIKSHNHSRRNCFCLPCNHCSKWKWAVEEPMVIICILRTAGKLLYSKLCKPAYFDRLT